LRLRRRKVRKCGRVPIALAGDDPRAGLEYRRWSVQVAFLHCCFASYDGAILTASLTARKIFEALPDPRWVSRTFPYPGGRPQLPSKRRIYHAQMRFLRVTAQLLGPLLSWESHLAAAERSGWGCWGRRCNECLREGAGSPRDAKGPDQKGPLRSRAHFRLALFQTPRLARPAPEMPPPRRKRHPLHRRRQDVKTSSSARS
jgi:hypothetical protein